MGNPRAGFTLALAVLAAACTGGDSTGGSADTLLTTLPPTSTTVAATSTTTTTLPATTTTVPVATTTTSTSTTTTTVAGTEVAGAGDGNTADTLVQLPITGPEPELAALALLALLAGVWLVRWSGIWQVRLARLGRRAWRRPGAPSADLNTNPPWPPNASNPVTSADHEFRRLAHELADRHGVAFIDGVDAYSTAWIGSFDLTVAYPVEVEEPLDRWRRDLAHEVSRLYGRG
ncbi:MAG: hypothetical protein ACR2OI_04765 [Acidimicrobiia bacterium]